MVGFGGEVKEWRSRRERSGVLSKEKCIGTCVPTFSLFEKWRERNKHIKLGESSYDVLGVESSLKVNVSLISMY